MACRPAFTTDDEHCGPQRRALRAALAARGIGSAVLDAVTAEPRDPYLGAYEILGRSDLGRLDPQDDPARWLRHLYDPDIALRLILCQDRFAHVAAPSLVTMARMSDLAGIHPGHTVLEIGTGSGYTSGLACRLAGAGLVRSLEPHPGWHAHASTALAGRADIVHSTDLTLTRYTGPAADRIIAWREPDHLPRRWLSHLRPGGRIVTVYGGAITVLTIEEGSILARFHHPAEVTALDADPRLNPHSAWADFAVLPEPLRPAEPGTRLMLRCLLPTLRWSLARTGSGPHLVLHDPATGSRAQISCAPHGRCQQSGRVPLWDAMQGVQALWRTLGKPSPREFAAVIDPAEHLPVLRHYGRIVMLPDARGQGPS